MRFLDHGSTFLQPDRAYTRAKASMNTGRASVRELETISELGISWDFVSRVS